jgi:anti-sigma regulatory factor (Ser/Thr protein kinase)
VSTDSLSRVLTMPRIPRATSEARHWVRETLVGWKLGRLVAPAEQIASELIANSVTHARAGASVLVLLMYAAGTLRLEVRDEDPLNLPTLKSPSPCAEDGRGLFLVDELSQRWGTRVTDNGKAVWSELEAAQHRNSQSVGIPSGEGGDRL